MVEMLYFALYHAYAVYLCSVLEIIYHQYQLLVSYVWSCMYECVCMYMCLFLLLILLLLLLLLNRNNLNLSNFFTSR